MCFFFFVRAVNVKINSSHNRLAGERRTYCTQSSDKNKKEKNEVTRNNTKLKSITFSTKVIAYNRLKWRFIYAHITFFGGLFVFRLFFFGFAFSKTNVNLLNVKKSNLNASDLSTIVLFTFRDCFFPYENPEKINSLQLQTVSNSECDTCDVIISVQETFE